MHVVPMANRHQRVITRANVGTILFRRATRSIRHEKRASQFTPRPALYARPPDLHDARYAEPDIFLLGRGDMCDMSFVCTRL
jgi:hypothetical protein